MLIHNSNFQDKDTSEVKTLRIATRKSNLALWQARHVARLLEQHHPELKVELLPLSTRGDEILDRSLDKVGGKGLFIKELEEAMLRGDADIAVHSMKDVPGQMPDGFCIAAVMTRAEPYDALVAHVETLFDLPVDAVIGTSSQRRAAQLLSVRPDLKIKPIRGNVETRLNKWRSGDFDAIVLAQAGLVRLGLEQNISQVLSPEICLPAVAQGIIGIECLSNKHEVRSLLHNLNDPVTSVVLKAERAFNRELGGDCHSPVAAFARFDGENLGLTGLVARPEGSKVIRAQKNKIFMRETERSVLLNMADDLGQQLAQEAIALGAQALF